MTCHLSTTAVRWNSADLSWTAPADDGTPGTASGYDIRYSRSPITATSWVSATQVTGEPTPLAVTQGNTYYLRIQEGSSIATP